MKKLLREVHGAKWDVVLISETAAKQRSLGDRARTRCNRVGQIRNKHGVAIIVNSMWKNTTNWVECASERVVAASVSVSKQPITLVSMYMPHSGDPDHQVEKTYETIRRVIDKDRHMKIIGGDFNGERGPGTVLSRQVLVTHYTLNKANCRGEWMTQWLLEKNLVALNTMYKQHVRSK